MALTAMLRRRAIGSRRLNVEVFCDGLGGRAMFFEPVLGLIRCNRREPRTAAMAIGAARLSVLGQRPTLAGQEPSAVGGLIEGLLTEVKIVAVVVVFPLVDAVGSCRIVLETVNNSLHRKC